MRRRWRGGVGRHHERGGGDEFRAVLVEAGHGERPGPDRLASEGVLGQRTDRHTAQEVLRDDRLGRRLEEPTERRREPEDDHPRTVGRDRDLVPRTGARPGVLRVLQDLDREGDVGRGDRIAVMPAGVVAQHEGPHAPGRIHGPALRKVGNDRTGGTVPDESREDQGDEIAIRLAPGRERTDRDRSSEDALAIGSHEGRRQTRTGRRRDRSGGREGRDADQARDEREQDDKAPDDERVGTGHRIPSERSIAAVAAIPDQAVTAGARMKAASEKTTNRTSRTIVNCHSRRSTPRRLR